MSDLADIIIVARLGAPFGVKGWLHLTSYTSPADNILRYSQWYLQLPGASDWQSVSDVRCQQRPKGFVAHFAGLDDRDVAATYRGASIGVAASSLEPCDEDEVYWRDLIGCTVTLADGNALGTVADLLETGAHDVMVVRKGGEEHLIPFADHFVRQVDLANRAVLVDWQEDW